MIQHRKLQRLQAFDAVEGGVCLSFQLLGFTASVMASRQLKRLVSPNLVPRVILVARLIF
jgi:hypothetical protein